MLKIIRNIINSTRLDYISKKRKKELSKIIEADKISHLSPTVNCSSEWYGNSYGGFYVNPDLLSKSSIVYSFGIGKDISFDKMIMKNHKCKVFAFDPTPKSINYIKEMGPPNLFIFFDYGITAYASGPFNFYLPANPKGISGSLMNTESVDSTNTITVQMKSFDDIVKELGHTHIDLLKMDIEGSEYEVLEKILDSNFEIDQIIVEFHDRLFDTNTYKSIDTVNKMKGKGYEIFASSNTFEEISFIHKRKLK